jgi:hypothetical protein
MVAGAIDRTSNPTPELEGQAKLVTAIETNSKYGQRARIDQVLGDFDDELLGRLETIMGIDPAQTDGLETANRRRQIIFLSDHCLEQLELQANTLARQKDSVELP